MRVNGRASGINELVEPGVVPVDEWRPDTPPTGRFIAHYAAVARKP